MNSPTTSTPSSSKPTRLIMLGGFLGSGKTTTIARLAREYQAQGLSVGIVTNDQASELVDTLNLRSQGFNVGEIAGMCLCADLNELTSAASQLSLSTHLDVLLVEPVGSCIDLVSTVIKPLRRFFAEEFYVAPYGVLLKPKHGMHILRGTGKGVSPQAEYLFRQQLSEADFVVMNRIDELSPETVAEIGELFHQQYPTTPLIQVSAKTGAGFSEFLSMLDQQGNFATRLLDVDYDKYSAGEAALGWINGTYLARSDTSFLLDSAVLDLVTRLQHAFRAVNAEPAHLKLMGLWEGAHSVANLIASDQPAELSVASNQNVTRAHFVLNGRVEISPDQLDAIVKQTMQRWCEYYSLTIDDQLVQSFRPGTGVEYKATFPGVPSLRP